MDSLNIDNLKKVGEEFANKYYYDWCNDPTSLITYVNYLLLFFLAYQATRFIEITKSYYQFIIVNLIFVQKRKNKIRAFTTVF